MFTSGTSAVGTSQYGESARRNRSASNLGSWPLAISDASLVR